MSSPVVTGVVVNDNEERVKSSNSGTTIQATAVAVPVAEGTAHVTARPTENAQIGICRRCGREFTRPPGVNDGQAQYYRCAECESYRWQDIFEGSCAVC